MKSNLAKREHTNREIGVKLRARRLRDLLLHVDKKRQAEMIRFHTCCADPRASK